MEVATRTINRFFESYHEEVAKHQRRVELGEQPKFPFLDFTNQVLPAVAAYLLIVAVLIFIMKQKSSPFKLKGILLVYNVICVILAAAVCVIIVMSFPGTFICTPFDVETPAGKLRAFGMWLYYIQKYFEFFDTFFFILRQSWRQVTFLHVYHHASIAVVVHQFMMYDINGDSMVAAFMNSFIHVLMYSHYFMAIIGIKSWYRKYLTQLQLVQFTIILLQMVVSYNIGSHCGVPDFLKLLQIVYQISMLGLFLNFYFRAYSDEEKPKAIKGEKPKSS